GWKEWGGGGGAGGGAGGGVAFGSVVCASWSHSCSHPVLSPGSIRAQVRAISNTSPPPCCACATRRRVWPPKGWLGVKKSNICVFLVFRQSWKIIRNYLKGNTRVKEGHSFLHDA